MKGSPHNSITLMNLEIDIGRDFFGFFYVDFVYKLALVGRVFANGLGDLGSIPGRIIPKSLRMVLDTPLLNTQRYKVRIKNKVEQSRERSSALPYTLV